MSQRGIAHIFLLLILLVGLGVGFYLVNYTQTNLKPKASESEEFVRFYNLDDPEGKNPTKEIIGNEGMYMEVVKLPDGWVWPEEKSSSLFPVVNAQEVQENIKCPVDESCCLKPLGDAKCTNNDECVAKNPDYGWCYTGYCIKNDYRQGGSCVSNSIVLPVEQPEKKPGHILNRIAIYSDGFQAPDKRTIAGNQDFGLGKKIKMQLNQQKVRDVYGAYSQVIIPIEVRFVAEEGCLKGASDNNCYTESIKTSIKLKPTSNSSDIDSIPKVKSGLEPDKKQRDAPDLPDIDDSQLMVVPVEVFIHTSLNYGLASSIANNAINYRMNPLLKKAGKKLKIINTSSISHNRCPDAGCKLPPKTIGLYMYAQGNYFTRMKNEDGIGYPAIMQAGVTITSDQTLSENIIIHELLHIFNLPDYYQENVSRNEVSSDYYTFGSYNQDVMSGVGSTNNPIISNVSLNMVKGITSLPAASTNDSRFMGDVMAWLYIPGNLIIKVSASPAGYNTVKTYEGALVEVFPQVLKDGEYVISREEKSFSGVTDAEGKVNLGNHTNYMGYGRSAFIKVSKDGKTAYRPITRSELNKLFFEGKVSDAEIEIILY